jgi:A/G-specific adenine glycosylase
MSRKTDKKIPSKPQNKLPQQEFFEAVLADFFAKAGREHLPWRKEGITAYEVWVSEVMLQQTQVSRVIDYYEKFLRRFPTIEDLARVSWEEFLPYYAGLGYYRRGRGMLLTAKKVIADYGGVFPSDIKTLQTLPGIGEYTAAAIASFAYGQNTIAWDTNVRRVIGRFFFGGKEFDTKSMSFTMPSEQLNAALMDFGSAICLGRPRCNVCPLRLHCEAFALGRMLEQSNTSQTKKKNTIKQKTLKKTIVFLWLHEEHRVYYSSQNTSFEPFILPQGVVSRATIKDYFREQYGLELAVRPPHKKAVKAGVLMLCVNAQILLGTPSFTTFSKEAVKRYNSNADGKSIF